VVSVTRDGGKHWTNVTPNIRGLPPWGYIWGIEPSRHALGTAYLAVDRHRRGAAPPLVPPGTYTVKLSVPDQELVTKLVVREDPNAPGS
jgi:hypothetical protein